MRNSGSSLRRQAQAFRRREHERRPTLPALKAGLPQLLMRAILTWHSLDWSGSPISLTPDEFRRQLAWLTGGAVRVVSLERLLTLPEDTAAVALTFDDGFANFATEAAPLLQEHGLPVTLFIVTGQVGRDNRWRGCGEPGVPVLPLLDWDAIGKLREAGVSLGAHTRTHPRLSRCAADELQAELVLAADDMQRRLGERPRGFAYPYGDAGSPVAEAAASVYGWACTTEFRALSTRDASNRLPRLDAWYFRDPARFAGWGSVRFRGWLWTHRQRRRVRAAHFRSGQTMVSSAEPTSPVVGPCPHP